ncbi:hypothetical protein [Novosphingobium sp. KN65.2]|nr:hypothetical protein [Novosphingobium sp. KN65.2]CDO38167.1 hypothetical protein SPHV1_520003 [Novosphingobium sp. KN65.2]
MPPPVTPEHAAPDDEIGEMIAKKRSAGREAEKDLRDSMRPVE